MCYLSVQKQLNLLLTSNKLHSLEHNGLHQKLRGREGGEGGRERGGGREGGREGEEEREEGGECNSHSVSIDGEINETIKVGLFVF